MKITGADDTGLWERLKQHRVLQWGLAYCGAAVGFAQGYDIFAQTFGWPALITRIVMVLLVVGLPIALTLAWHQGYRRLPRVVIAAAVIGLVAAAGSVVYVGVPEEPAVGGPVAQLTVTRRPTSARVYIDGRPLPEGTTVSAPGGRQLIAVALGFYGEARTLAPGDASTLEIALRPTQLPSAEEYDRFLSLADTEITPSIEASDLEGVTEPTLRTALQSKLLRQLGDQPALDDLTRDVEALVRRGDSRAAVAMLLIESIRDGEIRRAAITDGLLAAAERGDAMASFFTAVSLRDELSQSANAIAPSDPDFAAYCSRLARAAKQGWAAVAGKYLAQDSCGQTPR